MTILIHLYTKQNSRLARHLWRKYSWETHTQNIRPLTITSADLTTLSLRITETLTHQHPEYINRSDDNTHFDSY